MNIKSKKVLPYVAAAVAASCGVASAATLTVTPTYASTERLAAEVTAVPSYTVGLPNLEIKVGSDAYRTGDTVTVTVAGGTVSSASAGGWDCGAAAGGLGVSGAMTFSLSSISGNVLTYAVARTTNDSPVYLSASTAKTCSLAAGGILLVGNSISSGATTSINYEPRGSGIAYDGLTGSSATGGTGAVNVLYAATQYILPTSSSRNFLGQGDAGTNVATAATISTAGTSFGTGTAGNSLTAFTKVDVFIKPLVAPSSRVLHEIVNELPAVPVPKLVPAVEIVAAVATFVPASPWPRKFLELEVGRMYCVAA